MPPRSVLSALRRALTVMAAAAVLAGGVLVPASAVGASTGCNVLTGLLGACSMSATPTAATSTSPTCAGPTLYKANGTPWRCTFDAEFNGARLNRAKWAVQRTSTWGFHSGNECIVDSPQNVSVSHGHLNLTVRDVGHEFTCLSPTGSYRTRYTGATVFSRAFGQHYGRFEFRAEFPESHGIAGLQSSLWLYPRQMSAGTVISGATEVDVAEAYSRDANVVVPVVHGISVSAALPWSYCTVPDWGAAFHTYAAEWAPGAVTFSVDGQTCLRIPEPPSVPGLGASQPFLIALSQTLGVRKNTNTSASPLPGTTKIDYVRAWS